MVAKKRIKKKTYKEFLSWLEGVESMQEDDWVPTASQWKTIREMLSNVKPEEVEVPTPANIPPARVPVNPGQPVGRMIDPAGVRPTPAPVAPIQQSQLEMPKQPKVQPLPQPSGMGQIPTEKQALLAAGEEHQNNEFL